MSGVSISSGFTQGCVSDTATANSCKTGGSQSGYATYLFNAIQPTISPSDGEGLFSFVGLTIKDRAGNDVTVDSSNFTDYSIWIDSIKPEITSSGFVNNNIIYSGLSQDQDNVLSSGVTPTSGVGSLNVYLVSGILDYNVTITETFNEYTSGAVKFEVSLIPTDKYVGSGLVSGAIPSSFIHHNSNTYLRAENGSSAILESGYFLGPDSGVTNIGFNLDTSGLENGTYELVVDLLDYAGNTNKVVYVLYVNNPLQFIDVTQVANNLLRLNFSTTVKLSGLFETTGFESGLRVLVKRTGTTIDTQIFGSIAFQPGDRFITISIVQNEGQDQFQFNNGDEITVIIEAPGIAKLFNILDVPILQVNNNNRRTITWIALG